MSTTKPDDQEITFAPDIFITPGVVMLDEDLQPLDTKIYAIIYWFEHLKEGRCFASNKTIAKVANCSTSAVANSLVRLTKAGHITRLIDRDTMQRVGLRCNVYAQNAETTHVEDAVVGGGYSNEEGGVTQMSNRDNNTKSKSIMSKTNEKQTEPSDSTELRDMQRLYLGYLIEFVVERSHYEVADKAIQASMVEAAKKKYRLTPGRRDAILRRLADAGFEMCRKAIKGYAAEGFYRGENNNKWKATIEFIFRSYEKIETGANKFEAQEEEQ